MAAPTCKVSSSPSGLIVILSIILMTLTTMTIIIDINDVVTAAAVFTYVAAEGGNLNDPYLPYAYPVDCCAYELSGTTEDSFPTLPLILVDPSDTRNYGNTFFWPAGSRGVIPRKLNRDNNNTNSNTSTTDINDGSSSDAVPKCNSTNFSIWYGYFDAYDPLVKGWTLYEWNPSPVKGEPVHIQNNAIWATSIVTTNYRFELAGRLIKVDLECTSPLLSVPPQQNCVFLWLGPIHPWWRHKYGDDQCIGATTTIIPPMPSNNGGGTITPTGGSRSGGVKPFLAYLSSIALLSIMISLQSMWHIIL